MSYADSEDFCEYIDAGAWGSARAVLGVLAPMLAPHSVADFGAGQGVWARAWQDAGAGEVLALDGPWVQLDRLAVPEACFRAADLSQPIDLERRFDIVQSLEVAEHLPPAASEVFIDTLTRHSGLVLFSAAVPGQGGENHVNERPLAYWRALFAARGYQPFDCIRPHVADQKAVMPWYRYNTVLYAHESAVEGLPEEIRATALSPDQALTEGGDLRWRLRRRVVSALPRPAVTAIARVRARVLAGLAKR